MLKDEIWLGLLAENVDISYDSAKTLWESLSTQLETRLTNGVPIYIEGLGLWETYKSAPFIAQTSDLQRYLVPPQLRLQILPLSTIRPQLIRLDQLAEAIATQTAVLPEVVLSYLQAIIPLLLKQTEQGQSISWPRLGIFTPTESNDLSFTIDLHFAEAINKPFGMFVATPITKAVEQEEDLIIREVADIEELYLHPSISISLSPITEPTTEEVTPIVEHEEEEEDPQTEEEGTSESEPAESPELTQEEELISTEEELPQEQTSIDIEDEEEEEEQEEEQEMVNTPASPKRYIWYWVATVLLIIVSLVTVMKQCNRETTPVPTPTPKATPPIAVDSTPAPTDSIIPDSLSVAESEEVEHSDISERVEIIQIDKGMTLTKYALKKYGNKVFWVYIYQENKALISDPNNIPIGTRLTLPPASKYGIAPLDTNSTHRALELQRSINRSHPKL